VSEAGEGAGDGGLSVRKMVPTMRWPPAWATKTSCKRVPLTVAAWGNKRGSGSGGRSAALGTRVSSPFMGVPSLLSGRGSRAFVNFGTNIEVGGRSNVSALSCEPLRCWRRSIIEPEKLRRAMVAASVSRGVRADRRAGPGRLVRRVVRWCGAAQYISCCVWATDCANRCVFRCGPRVRPLYLRERTAQVYVVPRVCQISRLQQRCVNSIPSALAKKMLKSTSPLVDLPCA